MSKRTFIKSSTVPSNGWQRKKLGDVATFFNGRAYKQAELLLVGKYRVLRVGNFFTKDDWYYSNLELEDEKYVEDGDLMYAWSASFGPRFWNGPKTIYHYHIWKVIPNELISKKFLYYSLLFDLDTILRSKQGGTMFHITKGDIEKREIYVPPYQEQIKIAKILSAFDQAIDKLTLIIAAKEKRKKGLMQKLLTGEVRFKEFKNEKWKCLELREVFRFLSTSSFPREKLNYERSKDSVFCIHYGDIHSKYQNNFLDFNTENVPILNSNETISSSTDYLKDGDLILADASEDYDGVAKNIELCNVQSRKVISGLHTFALRDYSNKTVSKFRSYILSHPEVSNNLKKLATGSKVYGISKSNISMLKLYLPSIKEQKKIASILQSCGYEMQQLKSQLDKLKMQKLAMMQELLTGKIRVKL
jgi:type I restriction enzyme S subunit